MVNAVHDQLFMSGVNKVMLLGKVSGPPSFQQPDGLPKLAFRLLTTEELHKQGESYVHEEGHDIVMDGHQAEKVKHLIAEGSYLFLEGSLKTAAFTDKAGVRRYHTYVRAYHAELIKP